MKRVFKLHLIALIALSLTKVSQTQAAEYGFGFYGTHRIIAKNGIATDWYEALGGGARLIFKGNSFNYGVNFAYEQANSNTNTATELDFTNMAAEPFAQIMFNSKSNIPLFLEIRVPIGQLNSDTLGSRLYYGGASGLGVEFNFTAKLIGQLSAIGYYMFETTGSETYRVLNHELSFMYIF